MEIVSRREEGAGLLKNYKRFVLGREAIKYVRGILERGRFLSKCLLQCCDFDNGEVIAYLPANVPYE